MSLRKKLERFFKSSDLFSTSQFFRFKSKERYQSLFGAFISLLILAIVIYIFVYKAIPCFNKVNISSSMKQSIAYNPPPYNLTTYPAGNFMAAIEVPGIDYNDSIVRYFDYGFLMYGSYIVNQTTTPVNQQYRILYYLEPCTDSHWQGFPAISESLKLLNMSRLLCLPQSFVLPVEGKFIAQRQFYFDFHINRTSCAVNPNDPRRCATNAEYDKLYLNTVKSRLQLYFINYRVFPQNQQPVSYFLDDRYYSPFSKIKGAVQTVFMQDFYVNTDQSVYSISNITSYAGITVQQPSVRTQYLQATNVSLASVRMRKSIYSTQYYRRFQKIQNHISIAGGLFAIIIPFMFLMRSYSNSAYQISLGSELFMEGQSKYKKIFKKYNFFHYLIQGVFSFFRFFGLCKSWSETIQYNNCSRQVSKQTDVLSLIKKLLFLQSAVDVVLQAHHARGLHLRQKNSLEQANKKMEELNLKKYVKKMHIRQLQQIQGKGNEQFSQSSDQQQIEEKLKKLNKAQKLKFLADLARIQRQALNGQKISKKIVEKIDFINQKEQKKSVSGGVKQQVKQQMKQQQVKQQITKQIISPIMLNDTQNYLQKQENNAEEQIQNQKQGQQSSEGMNRQIKSDEQEPEGLMNKEEEQDKDEQDKENQKNGKQYRSRRCRPLNYIRNLIPSFDIFAARQLFRLQGQREHRTVFGGFVSVVIVVWLLVILILNIVSCVYKQTIYTTEQKAFFIDPQQQMVISTVPAGNFMGGIFSSMPIVNLDPKIRYFDYELQQINRTFDPMTNTWNQTVTPYPLEVCTQDHWNPFPQIKKQVYLLYTNYSQLLCFPMNVNFSLQGRPDSLQTKTFDLVVRKCRNATNPKLPCNLTATNNLFATTKSIPVGLILTNTLINPENQDFLSFYSLEKIINWISLQAINSYSLPFDQYIIKTDQSIFPWTQFSNQSVASASSSQYPLITVNNTNASQQYTRISLMRSPNSRIFTRSFQKVVNIIAFVGGLFVVIMGVFFFVNSYNILAFQVFLGSKLFKPDPKDQALFKQFNFWRYIRQLMERALLTFRILIPLQMYETIQYQKCQEQIEKQLDVINILKRVEFLENAIETVLQEHEIKGLHLRQKPTIDELKEQRRAFKLHKKVENIEKYKSTVKPKKAKKNAKYGEGNDDSDSDDSSEQGNKKERLQILEDMKALQQQATKGDIVSKRVIARTSKRASAIMLKSTQNDSPNALKQSYPSVTQWNKTDEKDVSRNQLNGKEAILSIFGVKK